MLMFITMTILLYMASKTWLEISSTPKFQLLARESL